MKHKAFLNPLSFPWLASLLFAAALQAQDAKAHYANMAAPEQYMMARSAEIALALSAAPKSISGAAEIMVMGPHGYETAVKGSNGFVCLVERSWSAGSDDPEFWNPKVRSPTCFNPPAVRTVVPRTMRKAALALSGKSKAEIVAAMKTALDKKELPPLAPGAMCYMMSKDQYIADGAGHWHPHLMFFVPQTDPSTWGANMPNSPVIGLPAPEDQLTVFMVPIEKWSDGTSVEMMGH